MIPSVQECSVYWHGHLPGNKKKRVKVGTLVRNQEHLYFGYDSRWISHGIEISPGFLPLSTGTKPISLTDQRSAAYMEDTGLRNEFRGLPGPFYDSLPDRWGMRLLAIQQVSESVKKWGHFAKSAGIPKMIADRYGKRMRDIRPDGMD